MMHKKTTPHHEVLCIVLRFRRLPNLQCDRENSLLQRSPYVSPSLFGRNSSPRGHITLSRFLSCSIFVLSSAEWHITSRLSLLCLFFFPHRLLWIIFFEDIRALKIANQREENSSSMAKVNATLMFQVVARCLRDLWDSITETQSASYMLSSQIIATAFNLKDQNYL